MLIEWNQHILLINNAGISFRMFSLIKLMYGNLSQLRLSTDSLCLGSSAWKTKLLRDSPLRNYLVQFDLKRSMLVSVEHVSAL